MTQRHLTAGQVVDPVESLSELKFDTRKIEKSICRLDEIVEVPVSVPQYTTCHTSIVSTGKRGRAPGELNHPSDVAIHGESHQILVVNSQNNRVEIFSETGEFISQLGVGHLSNPNGIAIHGDSVYISCLCKHTVSKFSLIKVCLVRRIGGRGSNNGQFNIPRQLTTDTIGLVFIADMSNDRICIHDPGLNHLRNIKHQSMLRPFGVKVSRDCLYVLCPLNSPCMHVLTLEGDMLRSFIICGEEMNVLEPYNFCLDPLNNFVFSDIESHSFCVFSPEGNLRHTIGKHGERPGMFLYPSGVSITPNGRLVCVSLIGNYGLQIFN